MEELVRFTSRVAKVLIPVGHGLLAWAVVVAVVGLLMPRGAKDLDAVVPLLLAGQVLSVAFNLMPGEVRAASRDAGLVRLALLVQWTVLPVIGLLLHVIAPTPAAATGIMICAAASAEITSGLMATITGGDTALAMACMSGSLALSSVLTPFWLYAPCFRSWWGSACERTFPRSPAGAICFWT
ncbi:MAG: hypothetical protein ACRENX_04980 [Candidatus Dormibacteria bacterium]